MPVAVTPGAEKAEAYAFVLEAIGIGHRIVADAGGWAILVAARDARRAARALAAYEAENRAAPPAPPPPPEFGRTWAGLMSAAVLIGFFAVTGPRDGGGIWFDRGSASAAILGGEPWRAVTSLTLHADVLHVLGNALACAVFVTAVARWLGPGLGIGLVLLAGTGGNILSAIALGAFTTSVGASTATFGALGILAAHQVAARRRRPGVRRAWVAAAAALALLGLLGTGGRADVPAHVLGLLVGAALGAAASAAGRKPPGRPVQWCLLVLVAAAIVACWWIALAMRPGR
jgi:membrane associated rhomboid family serine protease